MLKIRELLTDYEVTIYFSHVLSQNVENQPKGLDDLLIELKGREDQVLSDLMQLGIPGQLFYRLNVSSYLKKLQPYFNLQSAEKFYEAWYDLIGNREFQYFGTKYKYDDTKKALVKTLPKEAKDFMRVGDDYYELVEIPTIYEDTETKLVRRAKSTITDDFGKDIFKSIPKYKAFTNMPSHTNFQKVINNCYNKYAPFTHEPKDGDWHTTKFFLEHIFGEHYEYGLDYIQILYQHPTQILPILCLVSKENKTGKTTFLDFLKLIFGENACKVGNAELSNEFNSFTATRLVVGVDETFLEKKTTIEKIKMLSTSNRIAMQRKGVDHEEMWHFAKYILVSNNEDNFIYASDEDVRYWVRKVPQIKKEIPDMLTMLHEEVPAFLFMLNNRKISVQKTGRAWFDPLLLETEALRRLRTASKSTAEKEITGYMHNLFMEFGVAEIKMTIENLKERTVKNKYEDNYIARILNDNLKIEKSEKVQRYKLPRWSTDPMNDERIEKVYDPMPPGRPYIFKIEYFLSDAEMKQIGFIQPVEPQIIANDTEQPIKQPEQLECPY
jgi:sulfur relay (sulfurtransferase) DsrC/TusE family protein